ncbi:hypothetical protein [Evansella clarkii]|uniref:hypothetical protein n=1 Tax=Evansella clarkii TaxID=79879 RepID=UPI000997ADF8|nr:hypothetical protein [Evansella clarkii]
MREYKEVGFRPAALGGLAIRLKTEKGWFFVFGITPDLSEIQFDYSKTETYDDFTKSYDVDLSFGDGFYDGMKPHLVKTLKEFKLDKRSLSLFEKWYPGYPKQRGWV